MNEIKLNLPAEWRLSTETQTDDMGNEITHLEAYLPDEKNNVDICSVDVYAGPMPDGETAEDQAFSNYADVVGFDEDDPEDYNPIFSTKFDGRTAYGFEALCEDDSPMRLLSTELRKGLLVIICMAARDDESLDKLNGLIERSLRISRDK